MFNTSYNRNQHRPFNKSPDGRRRRFSRRAAIARKAFFLAGGGF